MYTDFQEVNAANISSLGVGGTIKKACFPKSLNDLQDIVHSLKGQNIRIFGKLTNTLVLSSGVDDLVIFTDLISGINVVDNTIIAYCGEKLSTICKIAQFYSLSGMENLYGIYGTVGGAVYGNSGAYGTEIKDVVESVNIVDLETGIVEELSRDEICFRHRYTNLRPNKDFVYSVKMRLQPSKCNTIALKMCDVIKKRKQTQPSEKSLGCAFKKVDGVSAGYYIEEVGLKGYEENGMEFSSVHANFIVNKGGTPEAYMHLLEMAEKKVYEEFGKKLIREVKVVGQP